MFVTTEPGSFIYTSKTDDEEVCGVHFLAGPDQKVEINFISFDVPCEHHGLISVKKITKRRNKNSNEILTHLRLSLRSLSNIYIVKNCNLYNIYYCIIEQVVDGWELNGEVFPSEMDHRLPLKQRNSEFCGKSVGVKRTFVSSQNVAVIRYRIPKPGKGFTVLARFLKNPRRKHPGSFLCYLIFHIILKWPLFRIPYTNRWLQVVHYWWDCT